MDWKLVYLSIYKSFQPQGSRREVSEIATLGENDNEFESLMEFLGSLIRQAKNKKASLNPGGGCRAYAFEKSQSGTEDQGICDQMLNAVSKNVFRDYADIIAHKYARSKKSRDGILFVVLANTPVEKTLSPTLFVFKTDFQSASFLDDAGKLNDKADMLIPDLKKFMLYPHYDGLNFRFDQIRIFQSSASAYFQGLLALEPLPDSHSIAEKALKEELDKINPEAYDKYFNLPKEDRTQKRPVFGEARMIREDDLLSADQITHISDLVQNQNVDQNAKPIRLKVQIDNNLLFEGEMHQINRNFFFAQNGLEKILLVRGTEFETKSHFQTIEFLKLENLEEVLRRLGQKEPA